jgi:hypothetical protein
MNSLDVSHPTYNLLFYMCVDVVGSKLDVDNIRENFCCPCKHCKNEKRYGIDDVLRSHLIKHGFKQD